MIQCTQAGGSIMERHKFGNSDLAVSIIGLGCYGMSGAYGPADDAESIATQAVTLVPDAPLAYDVRGRASCALNSQ